MHIKPYFMLWKRIYYTYECVCVLVVCILVFGCVSVRLCVCVYVNEFTAPNLNVYVLSMDHLPSTINHPPYTIHHSPVSIVHTLFTSILGSYFAYICYLNLISYIFICWAWMPSRGFVTGQQKVKDIYERYENLSSKFVRFSNVFKQ